MLWPILAATTAIFLGVLAFLYLKRRSRRSGGPVSIVLLRSSPRGLSESDVRSLVRRMWKAEPEIQAIPLDPTTSGFLVVTPDMPPVAIIDSRRTYSDRDDLARTASRHDHPVLRKAILEHTSWVSVDAMGVDASLPKSDRAKIYTLLAPLAAELIDDRTMLLFLPAEDKANEVTPEAEAALKRGSLEGLFNDYDLHSFLEHVTKDDPEITRAIAEARSRLPEFCSAWSRLGVKSEAMVKARFVTDPADDSAEIIWVSVTAETDTGFRGTIENHPVHPSLPRKGDSVSVKLEDIVDWAYLDEQGEGQGLFVDRILMQRANTR